MSTVNAEFENLNAYRNYPFSESSVMEDFDGAVLANDVFVDAILYPVVKTVVTPKLVLMDNGLVGISCGDVDMTGKADVDASSVELYDTYGRHAGTLVCGTGWKRECETARSRVFDIEFCSFVSCPIVYDGVERLVVGDSGTSRPRIELVGDGCITPFLENSNGKWYLSFDATNADVPEKEGIKELVVAAVGKTIFDITCIGESSVLLTAPLIDREDICWQAHRENETSEIADTCSNPDPPCEKDEPEYVEKECILVPSDVGTIDIVPDNLPNYDNPIHIGISDFSSTSDIPPMTGRMTADEAIENASTVLAGPKRIGNGLTISIPGL